MSPGPSSLAVAILALSHRSGSYPSKQAASDIENAIKYLTIVGASIRERADELEHLRTTCLGVLEVALRDISGRE